MQAITDFITSPLIIGGWLVGDAICLGVLIHDLATRNKGLMPLMNLVWGLTVLYSGPLGLAIYYYSGRRQIARDSLWRKGFRSVAHCYSGCGAGEIVGIFIAVGLLSLGNLWVAVITFTLAYVAGFALTMGPLMQEGEGFWEAFKDAAYSESASITVMEIVAIAVDLGLAGNATMWDTLFWSSLIVSLSMGLLAAYPINVLLIHWGVKEGMHSPKEMTHHNHHHQQQEET